MKQKSSFGFTLIELLVAISIISVLIAMGTVYYTGAQEKARAISIASDFKKIADAWQTWHATTQSDYINENGFCAASDCYSYATCQDEPDLNETALFSNVPAPGNTNWAGPYLTSEPKDPFGRGYLYDNDLDSYPTNNWTAGVNVGLAWCNATDGNQYIKIANIIDKAIDNGDGSANGKVRWDNAPAAGSLFYLVANYYKD